MVLAAGLCRCGCGSPVRESRRFVHGHNAFANPEQRIFERLAVSDELYRGFPCLLWDGPKSKAGYGTFGVRGKKMYVHRWTFACWVRALAQDETVDHQCHNDSDCMGGSDCPHRACWNPWHLEAVPLATNKSRGNSPAALNSRKTSCDHGHEFTPENTYVPKRYPQRHCKICRSQRQRIWRAKKGKGK
jgi:hypothetical protein